MGLISSKQAVKLMVKVSKQIRDSNYRNNLELYKNPIKIVSEGDSWFHFPLMPLLTDVINQLIFMANSPYAVFSAGYPGDDLLDFVHKDANGDLHGDVVDALAAENPHFLLISGGGNDILRSHRGGMEQIVRAVDPNEPGRSGAEYLADYYKNDLLVKVIDQYKNIFDHVQAHHPECHVLTYSYSYLRPTNDDYVEKPLSQKLSEGGKVGVNPVDLPGVDHKAVMTEIAKAVIDEFHTRLNALSANYSNVHLIDSRDALSDEDWFNEGHPNSSGCHKLACMFEDKMLDLLGLDERPELELADVDLME